MRCDATKGMCDMTSKQSGPALTRRGLLAGIPLFALGACSGIAPRGGAGVAQRPPGAALLLPVSGSAAGFAQAIQRAAQIAAPGQMPQVYDTGESAALATGAARAAVAAGASLLLGPLRADQVAAVVAGADKVPVVTFSNDNRVADGQVFVMGVTPEQSVATVFTYAKAQGLSRVAVIALDDALGRATAAAAERVAQAGQLSLAAVLLRDPQAGNPVADLRAASGGVLPDAVMIPDGGAVLGGFARGMRDAGVQVLGGVQWGASAEAGNPDLEGAWFAGPPPQVFDPFAARYEAAYGETAGLIAALGHDALILASAVAGARSARAELLRDKGFAGVLGRFRFAADGTCRRDLSVLTFRQGRVLALGEVGGT